MQTSGGRAFDLLNPREEDVSIVDMIVHLGRLPRFCGGTRVESYTGSDQRGYVVLQHCLLVGELLELWGYEPVIIRCGLLHECEEPYTGDISRPLQLAVAQMYAANLGSLRGDTVCMADPLKLIRHNCAVVCRRALGLPEIEPEIVKRADNVALAIEARDLMAAPPRDWELAERADTRIKVSHIMSPSEAMRTFREKLTDIETRIKAS